MTLSRSTPEPSPQPFRNLPRWLTISAVIVTLLAFAAFIYGLMVVNAEHRSDAAAASTSATAAQPVAAGEKEEALPASASEVVIGEEVDPEIAQRCKLNEIYRTSGADVFDVVTVCDGTFAKVGQYRSDHTALLQWNGHRWRRYPMHGMVKENFPCYDAARLAADGASAEFIEQVNICPAES